LGVGFLTLEKASIKRWVALRGMRFPTNKIKGFSMGYLRKLRACSIGMGEKRDASMGCERSRSFSFPDLLGIRFELVFERSGLQKLGSPRYGDLLSSIGI